MPSPAKFGLWYGRRTKLEPHGFVDGSKSDESLRQWQDEVKEEMTANRRLNGLNKKVMEEIDTRLWATKYLQYLTKRIYGTAPVPIKFTDPPSIENLSLSEEALPPPPKKQAEWPFKDLPLDTQLQILERRLEDARIGTEALWAGLNELIIRITSGRYSQLVRTCHELMKVVEILEYPADSEIGFRVFDCDSKARLFRTGDIRCGNWQEFDVNQGLTRLGAEEHITCTKTPTDYISLSTSPRRLWNLVDKWGSKNQKIAVIDLRILRRLGIAYGSTTDDLGFDNTGPNKTEFATRHHFLVVGWIPRQSILGFLSKGNFRKLLKEGQIDTTEEISRSI